MSHKLNPLLVLIKERAPIISPIAPAPTIPNFINWFTFAFKSTPVPKAFTNEEMDMILPTQLEGVVDKVYIPSVEEIRDLGRDKRIKKL